MSKQIYLAWPDIEIKIELFDNPAAEYYYKCIKHLQHIDLEFDERSNGLLDINFDLIADKLVSYATLLDLYIDRSKLTEQPYLNYLHDIYFNGIEKNFKNEWYNFHHYIHLLEEINGQRSRPKVVWIDYLEKSGLLAQPLDREMLQKYSVQNIDAGICFMRSHELGKVPLLYKQDNDTGNIMQLAVPWRTILPTIDIPAEDIRTYDHFVKYEEDEFNRWFAPHKEQWCNHHKLTNWTPAEMFAKIPIGKLDNLETFKLRFEQGNYPRRIRR